MALGWATCPPPHPPVSHDYSARILRFAHSELDGSLMRGTILGIVELLEISLDSS